MWHAIYPMKYTLMLIMLVVLKFLTGLCNLVNLVMMTSSNGNTFRVTGHLCGEFPGEFPDKVPWRGALMFSLICVGINVWVNNREAGDLRCYRANYEVIVMSFRVVSLAMIWPLQHQRNPECYGWNKLVPTHNKTQQNGDHVNILGYSVAGWNSILKPIYIKYPDSDPCGWIQHTMGTIDSNLQ